MKKCNLYVSQPHLKQQSQAGAFVLEMTVLLAYARRYVTLNIQDTQTASTTKDSKVLRHTGLRFCVFRGLGI